MILVGFGIKIERIVVEGLANILNTIETQEVESEAPEHGEEAGVTTDPAGVLSESHIAHIMQAMFDTPMVADQGGGVRRRQRRGGKVIGGFVARGPCLTPGIKHLCLALNLDQGLEVIMPWLGTNAGGKRPH